MAINAELFTTAQGRIGRQDYWLGGLLLLVAQVAVAFVLDQGGESAAKDLLGLATMIGFAVVGFLLSIKRLHDLDKSGWFSLLLLIPIVNFFVGLVWMGFFKGTAGENRFGADPLQIATTTAVEIQQ